MLVTSVRAAALDQSAATLGGSDPGAGPTPLANAPDAASTNGLATGRSGNANPRRRSVAAVWILRATPADASPPTFAASAINECARLHARAHPSAGAWSTAVAMNCP